MRKIYITFGGSQYDEITKKIVDNAPLLGADEVWVYDDVWVTQHEFYKQNKWLWEHPHKRGFGWYSWKPLIILDALSKLDDGDIVLFTDADTYPIRNINALYDTCNSEGAMFFEVTNEKNRAWCKKDCYIVMGQNDKKYYDVQAAVARFILIKKGEWRPYQLLMEWISYCVNPLANTFDKSILGEELDGFIEHRAEQAILTLLIHKHRFKLYREACELGETSKKDRDLYPQLFSQVNPWNKKNNNTAITAPAIGSKYRNIPSKNLLNSNYETIKYRKNKFHYINIFFNRQKITIKKTVSKILPQKIKDALKKYLK